jgi:hypothetical protein
MDSARDTGPIREARVFRHGLVQAGFAEDHRLAEVLDRYPPALIDINLYDLHEDGGHTLRTGARGALSGAELLKAIQQGRLWVNLRDVQDGWPDLWAAVMAEFDAIQSAIPGLKAVRNAGQLILSSPRSGAPYHFDNAGVVLFHMRGRKRVFVYPGDEAHLPELSMEQVVALQTTEEIPYSPDFEADASVIDLEPGQALTWPLYAPHRVRNLDQFCVSLSMDFQTWGSRFRNGALFTNAVLRERGGRPRPTDRMARPELAARWAAALALKKAGVMKSRIHDLTRDFEPDAEAADGVRAL